MSVAEAWCVAKPGANLALAVPTTIALDEDVIEFNAHKFYGKLFYPYLVYKNVVLFSQI